MSTLTTAMGRTAEELLRSVGRAIAGQSLKGLRSLADVEGKAETLKTPRLLILWPEHEAAGRDYERGLTEANDRDQAAAAALEAEYRDQGRDLHTLVLPNSFQGPAVQHYAKTFVARWAPELGLPETVSPGRCKEAINDRVRILAEVLARRYAIEGEPPELAELRAELVSQGRSIGAATITLTDARKAYRDGSSLSLRAELEPDVMRAASAVDAATKREDDTRRELWQRFAVQAR